MVKIGTLIKVHGVKGHLIADHSFKQIPDFTAWDALLIELVPNSFIPYFIEEIQEHTESSCRIKFEGIDTPELAKMLIQKKIYSSPNFSIDENLQSLDINSFIGYNLWDGEKEIGVVDNLLNPHLSPLFIINEDLANEILIPANEDLILSIDHDKKEIRMDLPEGLV